MRAIDKILLAAAIFVLVLVTMSLLQLPADIANTVESWGLAIVIGIIFGALIGIIVAQIPSSLTKVVFLIIPLGGLRISITVAMIAAFILQKALINWTPPFAIFSCTPLN